jgi:hypothetical protein
MPPDKRRHEFPQEMCAYTQVVFRGRKVVFTFRDSPAFTRAMSKASRASAFLPCPAPHEVVESEISMKARIIFHGVAILVLLATIAAS